MIRPRGRPRVNLQYHEARAIVRAEMLKSSVEYKKWWADNRPSMIPKNPNRAYAKVWTGWGDFLGSKNPFPCVRRSFRSYKDSRAWAHTLKFRNKAQWFEFCKSPEFPKDVPKRPDVYYQKSRTWLTWKDFLGYSVTDRTAALGETDHIIYIVQYPELPNNVFTIGITNEGKAGIISRRDQLGFNIIDGYYHDKETNWVELIAPYVKKYHIGERNYICNNIHDVIEVLSLRFLKVR